MGLVVKTQLQQHVAALRRCRTCKNMTPPPVSGGPVVSRVMLIGQAPGVKEPELQRPFAWKAGKTMFRWFEEACGIDEVTFRERVYIAAVCRCFPGKANSGGGDRVPDKTEIANCSQWLQSEFGILQPRLILPVGKLAITQFLPKTGKLVNVIGQQHAIEYAGIKCDAIPLPHPSGASTWHNSEPGKTLTREALTLISQHEAFQSLIGN